MLYYDMFILLSGQFGCRRIVRMLFLSSVVTQPLFVFGSFLLIFVTAYSLLALGSFPLFHWIRDRSCLWIHNHCFLRLRSHLFFNIFF